MTFYRLHDRYTGFPNPEDAEPNGLLAMGGDLSPERLLEAYAQGIFPWFSPGDPILWHSPDPRMVLLPKDLHVSRRLRGQLNANRWTVRYDHQFSAVVRACATVNRPGQDGTWISEEMVTAYTALFDLGYAHSVELYEGESLVGGVYGICIGRAFFGESMFFRRSGASKVALVHLVRRLSAWGVELVDCQQDTDHMRAFGARPVARSEFLAALNQALRHPTRLGPWPDGDL
jgi:leucyl/phenylalanyl-tRNA---protein transferase